ncbi:MAG: hypothetical protein HND49_10765 [Planctomycetes bacterium]|nr:hypothetical protein [Planctomycetota bacterium]
MRSIVWKEMVKVVFVVLVSVFMSCSVEAEPVKSMYAKLESRLSAYEDAFRSGDYVKAASFSSPEMVQAIGGEESFARLVQKFKDSTIMILDPSQMRFSKPEEIVSYDGMRVSVVTQMIPVTTKGVDQELKETYLQFNPTFPARVFEGMDGVFNLAIVAYSKDEGDTWFFTGGNGMGLRVVNIQPDILEKIDMPIPTLLFGEGDDTIKLVRHKRRWVMDVSGIRGTVGEESILFTLGENANDTQAGTTQAGMPEDSLDPYLYLGENTPLYQAR